MTAAEMKLEFLRSYDKIASLAAPGYTNNEISSILSRAQERIVKQRIHPKGNKYQESFEETEKRRKELQALLSPSTNSDGTIKTAVSTNQEGKINTNSIFYDLPDDLWLPIVEWLITDDECHSNKKIDVISHDEYWAAIDNPFKKPNVRKAWRLDAHPYDDKQRHEIVTDGNYDITEYHVRYIEKLTDIVVSDTAPVDCKLNSMFHREIIDEAVSIALEEVQQNRYSTHENENKKVE